MSHNNHTRYSKMYGEGNLTIDTFEPENKIETEPDPIDENESGYNESDRIEVEGQTEIEDVEPETEVVTESESTIEEDAVPEIKVEPAMFGQVFNCKKLNVRKFPDKGALIVSTLTDGTKVQIDKSCSTTLFYKICTECGIEGYCMKNFIKVLP